jgi:AAA15 family ATPase/GTPase
MENQHLTYFKVENFKKFDSLEVKDIGQFNLIVGDNNVGKTCLLEALLFDEFEDKLTFNYLQVLLKRGFINENYFKDKKKSFDSDNNLFKKRFVKKSTEEIIFQFKIDENLETLFIINSNLQKKGMHIPERMLVKDKVSFFELYNLSFETFNNKNKHNFPLINFNSIFEEDIFQLYNNLKTKSEKENLIKAIQVIDNNIVDVELRQNFDDLENVFLLSFKDKEEFIPVNYLGDGFKRIFYIILKVLSLKGKRIMIDEIETGIHYLRQKDFWLNIIRICRELDVQLFATTHSKECIEAFVEAAKEIEEKDIRLIKLQENKNKRIKAICYKEDYLDYMVQSNIEER